MQVVSSDEKFTLKANGNILSSNNDAVNEMGAIGGIDITLKAIYLKLRGGIGTKTQWDNIIFDRTSKGKIVTLKSITKKSSNR